MFTSELSNMSCTLQQKGRSQKQERPFPIQSRRRPTFPHSYPCSIIGPARLNFRVRDGNGCDPRGITTRNFLLAAEIRFSRISRSERDNRFGWHYRSDSKSNALCIFGFALPQRRFGKVL